MVRTIDIVCNFIRIIKISLSESRILKRHLDNIKEGRRISAGMTIDTIKCNIINGDLIEERH